MWLKRWTRKLDTMPCEDSNPTVNKKFSFCNFRLFRVPRSWTGSIQMKSSLTFIRGNMWIEREKDTFLNDGVAKRLFILVRTSFNSKSIKFDNRFLHKAFLLVLCTIFFLNCLPIYMYTSINAYFLPIFKFNYCQNHA